MVTQPHAGQERGGSVRLPMGTGLDLSELSCGCPVYEVWLLITTFGASVARTQMRHGGPGLALEGERMRAWWSRAHST